MGDLLAPLGLAAEHSAVYLALFDRPGAEIGELGDEVGLGRGVVRRVLDELLELGLVDRLPGMVSRYVAAPPEVAIDAAVLRRQQALDELRAAARDMVRRRRAEGGGSAQSAVEVVTGEEEVMRTLADLELGAREEVLVVDCPPYLNGHVMNTSQLQALARGVEYRAIYHAPVLREPEKLVHLRRYLEAGSRRGRCRTCG
ncbi:TrmB family transcriptional regulator [Actinokineospora soli]|uniref:TrmB family transcriptional regulator n=1 Tax=Actinokineospora soli TaxID=1048753 RepID=A0ABW2TV02_9PSEU